MMNQVDRLVYSNNFLLLIVALILSFLVWIAKCYWGRRRLYKLAAKIHGPPGYPVLGNIIDFIGISANGITLVLNRYFTTYPDLFKYWLGPSLFIGVSKPEYLEIVMNHPQCLEKPDIYKFTKVLLGDGLIAAPVHIWKKSRKMINPAFSQKILDSFVPTINEEAKILVDILRRNVGNNNLDLFPIMSACTLDTICETAMGVKVNAQTTKNNFGALLDRGMKVTLVRMLNVLYHLDIIFKWTKHHKFISESAQEIKNFTGQVITYKKDLFEKKMQGLKNGEIIEEGNKYPCLLDRLLQQSGNIKLTEIELTDQVNNFVAAGTDTTGVSLCFSFLTLGMFPEIQKKIYEEVIDVLGEDRDVTYKDLPHLQYMDRFLKETIRLFPAAPFIPRRTTAEIDMGDVTLPNNSTLIVSILAAHRNPKYWKDPLKFDPDRFLPEEIAKRHPYSYVPFYGGPRNCIGSKYAFTSMKSILAEVVRKMVLKTEYRSIEEVALTVHLLLRPLHGYKVSLELRE